MSERPNRDLEERRADVVSGGRRGDGTPERRGGAGDFWRGVGLDVETMSPRAQVTTSLALLVPVVLGLTALLFLQVWWPIFVLGWTVFPAFGLLLRGVAGLSEERPQGLRSGGSEERELLSALRERGELTPTEAAMETSLTVAEADRMLRDLAAGGHLAVRVRGGGLFYASWEHDEEASRGRP